MFDNYIFLMFTQLCVTETVLSVLFAISSILLIVSYCPRSGLNFLSKICAVSIVFFMTSSFDLYVIICVINLENFLQVLGILGSFAFGYAAQISYRWFQTGTHPDAL